MKKTILIITVLLFTLSISAQETLYYNGKIFIDKENFAKWFSVADGEITEVGNEALSESEIKKYDNAINLNGKTVIPGFIDSHIHFMDGSLGLLAVNLSSIENIDELKNELTNSKSELIDQMFIATGLSSYVPNSLDNPRLWLDEIMGDTPTFIFCDGHKTIANSAALKYLGFNKKTKIEEGILLKDKNGELNGYLLEEASFKANQLISQQLSMQTLQKATMLGQQRALSYGITTMGDNMFNPQYYKAYKELVNTDLLKIRFFTRSFGTSKYSWALLPALNVKKLGFIGKGVSPDRLKFHAAKYFISKSGTPPPDVVANKEDTIYIPGSSVFPSANKIAQYILTYDIPLAFHVQGEPSLQAILDAVEKTKSRTNNRRHVLDHVGYAKPKQLEQIKDNQLAVTILPYSTFEYPFLHEFYTNQEMEGFNIDYMLNHKSRYDVCDAAMSSDWPYAFEAAYKDSPHIDGLNPIPAIAVVSTGKTPDNKELIEDYKLLSVKEAVHSYTANGAYVLGKENTLGKIKIGYKADFVILQDDIFEAKDIDIYDIKVKTVYINGEQVYDTDAEKQDVVSLEFKKIKKSDYTISPVFGYDPSLGYLLGGAFFYWPILDKGTMFNTQLINTLDGQMKLIANYEAVHFKNKYSFGAKGFYRTFTDDYFGEGSNAQDSSRFKLNHNIIDAKVYLKYDIIKNTYLYFETALRNKTESFALDMEGKDMDTKISEAETNLNFSVKISYDNRDFDPTPRSGGNIDLSLDYLPVGLATLSQNNNLLQLNLNSTYFKQLYFPKVILGLHFSAGTTLAGNPSYLYRYKIGGDYLLRGYYVNRFRGAHFYHATTELRLPIYKIVSMAFFADFGDVADKKVSDFGTTKISYGTGVRFQLTEMAKLRFDFGFQPEGWGMFFTFNEAF